MTNARQEAVESVLRTMHWNYGKGNIREIKFTSWSTLDGNSHYPTGTPLRGYVIAQRTSSGVHAKEFNVYSHGAGKLRVHFLGRDRVAKFDGTTTEG